MKRLVLIAAMLVASISFASPTMQAECERQMALGLCTAANDTRPRAPGTMVLIAGVGRVPAEAYDYVRKGDKDMCRSVARACVANPRSDVCKIGRALWGR